MIVFSFFFTLIKQYSAHRKLDFFCRIFSKHALDHYGKFIILCIISFIILSCRMNYEHPRLTKTDIKIHSGNFSEYEALGYIRQKPNKKIFFSVPFHLGVYNFASELKDNSAKKSEKIDNKIKILQEKNKAIDYNKMNKKRNRTVRNWLMETIGEPPVFYDSLLTSQSVSQIQLYLRGTGHFNAETEAEVILRRNGKKAEVIYHIYGGIPYTIKDFTYMTKDGNLLPSLNHIMKRSLILEGMQYNEDILDAERDRITAFLRDHGYYHFSKSYIVFNADTSVGGNSISLEMVVNPYFEKSNDDIDEHIISRHPRSKVNNIIFNTDFRHDGSNIGLLDTTVIEYRRNKKDTNLLTYYFLHEGPLKIKPKTLLNKCFFRQGDYVSISDAVRTNSSIGSLGVYRYINIRFKENQKDSLGFTLMDIYIDMAKGQRQTYITEIEGTHSSGNMGISGNLLYRNRNMFRGSELLTFRIRGAIEAQTLFSEDIDDENIYDVLPFNTVETGIETDLSFPNFLMPFTEVLFTERNYPKTSLTAGLMFQKRPDYTRYIGNMSLTYNWQETVQKHWQWSPLFLSLIRIFPDSMFISRIEQLSRPLQYSYMDHLISGTRVTYTFTNKTAARKRKYVFLRANAEITGTLPRIFSSVFAGAEAGETYYLLGIRFAQYSKADIEFRQYINTAEKSSLVFRCFAGAGVPYGNIDVLPFDKRYSAGGSNDIRAWKFRSLGPGAYSDNLSFDKTGDLSLIVNFEYRFPVYDILHSALFIDAGNIWFLSEYEDYPGGNFVLDEFYKQIAIGTGAGLRLNFGYFIFRLDAAFPFYTPSFPENEKIIKWKDISKRTNLNFGIGYPF